jgi:hypothetical protein
MRTRRCRDQEERDAKDSRRAFVRSANATSAFSAYAIGARLATAGGWKIILTRRLPQRGQIMRSAGQKAHKAQIAARVFRPTRCEGSLGNSQGGVSRRTIASATGVRPANASSILAIQFM